MRFGVTEHFLFRRRKPKSPGENSAQCQTKAISFTTKKELHLLADTKTNGYSSKLIRIFAEHEKENKMNTDQSIEQAVYEFLMKKVKSSGDETSPASENPIWQTATQTGSQLWLDTGDINAASELWNTSFSALTTNNTLLNAEIQKGTYDQLVREATDVIRAANPAIDRKALILEIVFVLNAWHGLRLARIFNAKVSVELHTDFAHDTQASLFWARRYHAVSPQRFVVKLPFTESGLIAARQLSSDDIAINFTLGFSARQNYAAALIANPAYVNVFMGRLNAFVSNNDLGDGNSIGEKATLATRETLWRLREEGRTHTKLIGASIRNGTQVAQVLGTDVLTIPPSAAHDYGVIAAKGPLERPASSDDLHLDPAMRLEDFNGQSLWEISPQFGAAVEMVLSLHENELEAESIDRVFKENGVADLFPPLTSDERNTITNDGKIPKYGTWEKNLKERTIGLDSLMNAAALASFSKDQAALDHRIESLLKQQ